MPTPALALAIRQLGASGGINFTASHNPAEYNGIKFSTPNGAPALPEVTSRIEANIVAASGGNDGKTITPRSASQPAAIDRVDFSTAYMADLMRKVAPEGPIYQAGTLSGNPVATACGLATLREITNAPASANMTAKAANTLSRMAAWLIPVLMRA